MDKVIPKHYKHLFNTWEEYREWCIEKSKKELEKVFEKYEKNERTRTI